MRVAHALGFTTLRKHIKVEPDRYYHAADRLGMLIWQDMPSMYWVRNACYRMALLLMSCPAAVSESYCIHSSCWSSGRTCPPCTGCASGARSDMVGEQPAKQSAETCCLPALLAALQGTC